MIKNNAFLFKQIKRKKSFLCVGLDSSYEKIPTSLKEKYGNDVTEVVFQFNVAIIRETNEYAIAYKPNLAFYEELGASGMEALRMTIEYIKAIDKALYIIYDAKKGDIGNTGIRYAKAAYETFGADAITVNPYMGNDSILPFIGVSGQRPIVLGLTSNKGADDYQRLELRLGGTVSEEVIRKSSELWSEEELMYVVGGTKFESDLLRIRKIVPDYFLLVPGIGAQGGSLEMVVKNAMNSQCGLIVNSSRGIIFAGKGEEFALDAGLAAKELQEQMEVLLQPLLEESGIS